MKPLPLLLMFAWQLGTAPFQYECGEPSDHRNDEILFGLFHCTLLHFRATPYSKSILTPYQTCAMPLGREPAIALLLLKVQVGGIVPVIYKCPLTP